jgi:hypothetical protein
MDPYLEDPLLWPGVHSRLIVYIADQLLAQVRPRYFAAIEERVFIEGGGSDRQVVADVRISRGSKPAPFAGGTATAVAEEDAPAVLTIPGLEIHEPFVEIRDRETGKRVVTVIEVVSPTNKYAGPGRESYLAKQREVRASGTHLVEIDLLRRGPHIVSVPEHAARGRYDYDYLVCVNRGAGLRDTYELYHRKLRQRLPRVAVPLDAPDPDVRLDLPALLNQVYDAGAYADRLRYDEPCKPPLEPADQEWADVLTRNARAAGA